MSDKTHDIVADAVLKALDAVAGEDDPRQVAGDVARVVNVLKDGMEARGLDPAWLTGVSEALASAADAANDADAYIWLGVARERLRAVAEGGWD